MSKSTQTAFFNGIGTKPINQLTQADLAEMLGFFGFALRYRRKI